MKVLFCFVLFCARKNFLLSNSFGLQFYFEGFLEVCFCLFFVYRFFERGKIGRGTKKKKKSKNMNEGEKRKRKKRERKKTYHFSRKKEEKEKEK